MTRAQEKINAQGVLERPRNKWEGNVKINIKDIEWEDVEWTCLTQGRYQCWTVENTVLVIRIPYNGGQFSTK